MARKRNPKLAALSRHLRKTMSPAEIILWSKLKGNQIGFRVRRQCPMGNSILDFYIPKARLAIEIDGRFHNLRPGDPSRDQELEALGIRTLRFSGQEFGKDVDRVVEVIYATAVARCRELENS